MRLGMVATWELGDRIVSGGCRRIEARGPSIQKHETLPEKYTANAEQLEV
jgi:hypothetical protein